MFSIKSEADMFDEITMACNDMLNVRFPAGVPSEMRERLNLELSLVKGTGNVRQLYLYRKLERAVKKANAPILLHGTARNSILTWLLGDSLVDPNDAYYYCDKCGHFEKISGFIYGIDAEDKLCPECKSVMRKGGFSLDYRFALGIKGERRLHFDYNAPAEFIAIAREVIKKILPESEVVLMGADKWNETETGDWAKSDSKIRTGLVMLPIGKTLEDYPERKVTLDGGEEAFFYQCGDEEEFGIERMVIVDGELVEKLWQFKKEKKNCKMGLMDLEKYTWRDFDEKDYTSQSEWELTKSIKPETYYDMAKIGCLARGSFANGYEDCTFTSRDTLFHILCGNNPDPDECYQLAEFVRLGKAAQGGERWLALVEKSRMSKSVQNTCEHTRYLWSEAHALDYLLAYAQCAFYREHRMDG